MSCPCMPLFEIPPLVRPKPPWHVPTGRGLAAIETYIADMTAWIEEHLYVRYLEELNEYGGYQFVDNEIDPDTWLMKIITPYTLEHALEEAEAGNLKPLRVMHPKIVAYI